MLGLFFQFGAPTLGPVFPPALPLLRLLFPLSHSGRPLLLGSATPGLGSRFALDARSPLLGLALQAFLPRLGLVLEPLAPALDLPRPTLRLALEAASPLIGLAFPLRCPALGLLFPGLALTLQTLRETLPRLFLLGFARVFFRFTLFSEGLEHLLDLVLNVLEGLFDLLFLLVELFLELAQLLHLSLELFDLPFESLAFPLDLFAGFLNQLLRLSQFRGLALELFPELLEDGLGMGHGPHVGPALLVSGMGSEAQLARHSLRDRLGRGASRVAKSGLRVLDRKDGDSCGDAEGGDDGLHGGSSQRACGVATLPLRDFVPSIFKKAPGGPVRSWGPGGLDVSSLLAGHPRRPEWRRLLSASINNGRSKFYGSAATVSQARTAAEPCDRGAGSLGLGCRSSL